jgi:hypothetical protein
MSGQSRYCICLASLIAAAVVGCTAGDFKEPIQKFADATSEASKSLTDYEKTLDKAALDKMLASAERGELQIYLDDRECNSRAPRCQVRVKGEKGAVGILALQPIDPRIRGLMVGMVSYANSLVAIAKADTTSEIKTAADAAKGNVVGLAKAVDNLNVALGRKTDKLEPAITSIASPITDAVVFGLSLYVESVKLQALRYATSTMNEIFPDLTVVFVTVADGGMRYKRAALKRAFDNAYTEFSSNPKNRANIDAVVTAAQSYDAALAFDSGKIFMSLQDAHAALTKALLTPEPNFQTLWPLLQRVADQAAQLSDIALALQKAAEKK